MDIGPPFIRLPWQFDAARMAREVKALPDAAWMAHPSRMAGNSAVALVSREGGENDDFEGEMGPTPHLRRSPYLQQVMAAFGEVLGRSRLMRLAPGSEVALHVDFNYHWLRRVRIHVPITTQPEVTFYCADQAVHMGAGEAWIFNAWRRHRVVNGGDSDRVHLVIDTSGSSGFWRMVRDAAAAGPTAPIGEVHWDPDAEPAIETERCNTVPVMHPGELDGLVDSLIREFSAHPANDPALVGAYRRLLEDFALDWRVTWLRHGDAEAGRPVYQTLVDGVRAQLTQDPRALVTASNQIGVNPIIVQRILRPALR